MSGRSGDDAPDDRPSYVPDDWPGDRADRWLAARPGRMLAWWVVLALGCVAAAVITVVSDSDRTLAWVGVFVAPFAVLNAVVQGRRALRAMRDTAARGRPS